MTIGKNLLETDKTIPLNTYPAVDADEKAFRISTVVRINKDGVWRKIWFFMCPDSHNKGYLNLILGLPWLNEEDAKIFIHSTYIEVGDNSSGEKITKIRGPTFVPSEKHRLVLLPNNPKPACKGKIPVRLQSKSDQSESDSDQNITDSSKTSSNNSSGFDNSSESEN
ncbi:hypothetical protein GcM3_205027 [Golovinomyces cichoracearum]|uniref:Uncharacterized protein n=1 Tax=Golovinomyces cichoracearum TaxID=62708 RepID=A0A420HBU5_9PEZI|nr:hypothetical protein GcM3_205027 [Golovinomyces cichoracearum]